MNFLASAEDIQVIGKAELTKVIDAYSATFALQTCSVEISLIDEKGIQELNRQYRALDEPTDVLSFPTFPNLTAIQEAGLHSNSLLIGAIIICPEKATTYQESLIQLVHHGLLHLLGFDHDANLLEWVEQEEKIVHLLTDDYQLVIPGIPHDSF